MPSHKYIKNKHNTWTKKDSLQLPQFLQCKTFANIAEQIPQSVSLISTFFLKMNEHFGPAKLNDAYCKIAKYFQWNMACQEINSTKNR